MRMTRLIACTCMILLLAACQRPQVPTPEKPPEPQAEKKDEGR